MDSPKHIHIKEFSYELPEERIAKFPLADRDASKLLVYKGRQISEDLFLHIDEHLPSDSLIVFNNTKVVHARILFQRATGAHIEIFCLEPIHHFDYQLAFQSTGTCEWKCMVGNAKRWKDDILIKKIPSLHGEIELRAERVATLDDSFHIKFTWEPAHLHFSEVMHEAGLLPLPPYLNRENTESDEQRYQTIYAHEEGSVAAPTAGLHFTNRVLEKLEIKSIRKTFVTLHVGAGTFKPIKTDSLEQHVMHEEVVFISRASIELLCEYLEEMKPIIAVGTTGTRVLESLYWFGAQLLKGHKSTEMKISQWEPYEHHSLSIGSYNAICAILDMMKENNMDELHGSTQIIIAPGYEFKIVNVLITNFHQPENTLMLLVAAFTGDDWREIYQYALDHQFRFLSYGDSSVLFRE